MSATHGDVIAQLKAEGYTGTFGDMMAQWKLTSPNVEWDNLGGDKYGSLLWLTSHFIVSEIEDQIVSEAGETIISG